MKPGNRVTYVTSITSNQNQLFVFNSDVTKNHGVNIIFFGICVLYKELGNSNKCSYYQYWAKSFD